MDNAVTIIGSATRDPELKYTPSGQAVAQFGVAVNRRWQNKTTQEWEEQVSFFDVKCWAQMAENVCSTIAKGTRVVVVGRLEQRSWETDQGEKRSKVEIVADDVAPSLRWATAQVQRIERENAEQHRGKAAPTPVNAPAVTGEEPF
jgi:single-strand DNA-binding protein